MNDAEADEEKIEEQSNEGDVDEEEGAMAKPLPQPTRPSAREIAEHEISHVPYRSWCVHCVKGRARADAHRSAAKKEEGEETFRPAWSMDYLTLTDVAKDEHGVDQKDKETVLVCHEKRTGAVLAYAVEQKGVGDGWIVDRITRDFEEHGCGTQEIELKCDQEPAIVELQAEIVRRRGGARTVPTNSPVGASQSNGRAENANYPTGERTDSDNEERLRGTLGDPCWIEAPAFPVDDQVGGRPPHEVRRRCQR